MNARQIDIVRSTFARLAPQADAVAVRFYARLFDLDPTLRTLFKNDMLEQRAKLMAMLEVGVNGLAHVERLVPTLARLGASHVRYGVRDAHYDTVAVALLGTLREGLGADFTAEAREAWVAAFVLLAGAMKGVAGPAQAA